MSESTPAKKSSQSTPAKGKLTKSKSSRKNQVNVADNQVIEALTELYHTKLLPIEKQYLYHKFNQPPILDSELNAKPTVLLVGQYSTGKTSFIKHLIGMDYPEIHIGPEPTTDRFIAVVYGEDQKTIKGNALTGISDLPYSGLSIFGTNFLNKFSAAVVNAPLLKDVNIIDTPGVLSGEKQRTARGYDFAKVARWFADRSDLILLLFDCSKLDISDEFKSVIEELQPHEDKIHCVLNKADQLDQESLMRVYGALLWSMGRIFKGAEVTRIYVGSFHDTPLAREEHRHLFDKDKTVLMNHLATLPKACSMRKINEMVKRIRLAVVHVCIMGHLRSKMPYLWGKDVIQQYLIKNLADVFKDVQRQYQLAEGDFPKVDEYRAMLSMSDMSKFPHIDRGVLNTLQDILLEDVPSITALVAGVGEKDQEEDGEEASTKKSNAVSTKQPNMFTLSDDHANRDRDTGIPGLALIALVGVFVVLIPAVLMGLSSQEDHSTALKLLDSLSVQWNQAFGPK